MTIGGKMSKRNDDGFLKVNAFVNSAIDLAEGLERDIKNGVAINPDTVLRLNKFKKAAIRAAKLLEQFETETVKYKN